MAQVEALRQGWQAPEAASLGQYGEIPVGYYTGTPEISIPLYEVKSQTVSLPISLDYHASGIKINEIPEWVGLGWSLNAGGVITRSVRGLPDEKATDGYRYTGDRLYEDYNWPLPLSGGSPPGGCWADDYLCLVRTGSVDPEPDQYYFNFAGRAGQFIRIPAFVSGEEHIVTIPHSQLRIARVTGGWTITTEDGTVYTFTSTEQTDQASTTSGPQGSSNATSYISSWYLSEINDPTGHSTISLSYDSEYVSHTRPRTSESDGYKYCSTSSGGGSTFVAGPIDQYTSTTIGVHTPYLSKITYPEGEVILNSSGDRLDAPFGATGLRRLADVTVKSNSGSVVKRIVFEPSYFRNDRDEARRLRLASLRESGGDEQRVYVFDYYDANDDPSYMLPDYGSFSKDYWGYYNGASNASGLPAVPEEGLDGADRGVNAATIVAGTLEKITYPTGGSTLFKYEPHDYSRINSISVEPYEWNHRESSGNFFHYNRTNAWNDDPPGDRVFDRTDVVRPDVVDVMYDFEIEAMDASVDAVLTINRPLQSDGDGFVGEPTVRILRYDGNSYSEVFQARATGSSDIRTTTYPVADLQTGTYALEFSGVRVCSDDYCGASGTDVPDVKPADVSGNFFTATLSWSERIDQDRTRKLAGGIRVKEIHDNPSNGGPVRVRQYTYERPGQPGDPAVSSGVAVNEPVNLYQLDDPSGDCYFWERMANSRVPLGAAGPGGVGYSEVTESIGVLEQDGTVSSGLAGSRVFRFRTAADAPDLHYPDTQLPGLAPTSMAWKRGQMTGTDVLSFVGGQSQLIQQTTKQYDFNDDGLTGAISAFPDTDPTSTHPLLHLLRGSRIAFPLSYEKVDEGGTPYRVYIALVTPYYIISGFMHPATETVTEIDPEMNEISERVVTRSYEDVSGRPTLGQLTSVTESGSSIATRITEYEYAHERHATAMRDKNMLSQVYRTTVREGADVKARSWTTYRQSGDHLGIPQAEWLWRGDGSGSDPSAPDDPGGGETVRVREYAALDSYGRPIELADALGNATTLQYGVNNNGPYLTGVEVGTDPTLSVSYTYNDQGLVESVDDENDQRTCFDYDGLGRLEATRHIGTSDDCTGTSGTLLSTDAYHYTSGDPASDPNYVETQTYLDGSNVVTERVEYDGLGRPIRTRLKEGGNEIITETEYDGLGRVWKQYKPYRVANGLSLEYTDECAGQSPTAAFVETLYTPDPLGRPQEMAAPHCISTDRGDVIVRTDYGVQNGFSYQRVTDESGNQTRTETDAYGRTRKMVADVGGINATTTFEYDVLDNLESYTAPEGRGTTYEQVTSYDHNPLGQLTKKVAPDFFGPFEYAYDAAGNLRKTKDPNRSGGGYLFSDYDAFGRVTKSGLCENATFVPGELVGAGSACGNGSPLEVISYTYDTATPSEGRDGMTIENPKNHLTQVVSGDDYYQYSYDDQGRIARMHVHIDGLGSKHLRYVYDRQGNITELHYQEDGSSDAFHVWYEYDDAGRLYEVYSNMADDRSTAMKQAQYRYTPSGQVERLELGDAVQTVDYEYHIRDWMTKINAPGDLNDSGSMGGDAFAMRLGYDDDLGIPGGSSLTNGNVAATEWRTRGSTYASEHVGYAFTYDALNRLKKANFATWAGYWSDASFFDVNEVHYDANGNIKTLDRAVGNGDESTLSYSYFPGTNRLSGVTGISTPTFDYDANGNITTARTASNITYDHRNLPTSLTSEDGGVGYRYDANGQRIFKSTESGGATDESHYVRGADGAVIAVYLNGALMYWNILANGTPIGRADVVGGTPAQ